MIIGCARLETVNLTNSVHLLYSKEYDLYRLYDRSCYKAGLILDVENLYFNDTQGFCIISSSRSRIDTLFEEYSLHNCSVKTISGDSVILIGNIKTIIRDLTFRRAEEYDK